MADEKEEPKVEENAPKEAKDGAEGEESEKAEGEAGEEGDGKKFKLRLSYKKLAILAVPLVLALGAGGYFAKDYVMDMVGMSSSDSEGVAGPKVYYTLPEMVVNLSSLDARARYLKLKVSLEAPNQEVLDALNPIMPRVLDMFQLYLRELRSSDLEGSAGIYRLKEELLRRINLELHPKQINRVLFNEIIVQ